MEMATRLIAEADHGQRNFHFRLGKPRLRGRFAWHAMCCSTLTRRARSPVFGCSTFHPVPTDVVITTIVLIRVDPTLIPTAANMLAGVEGVTEVYSVSGDWDLVAIVRVPQYDQIAHVVTEVFPTVPGIQRTQTLTAFRAYSRKDLQQAWDIGVE